jgi:hypothetical protein
MLPKSECTEAVVHLLSTHHTHQAAHLRLKTPYCSQLVRGVTILGAKHWAAGG